MERKVEGRGLGVITLEHIRAHAQIVKYLGVRTKMRKTEMAGKSQEEASHIVQVQKGETKVFATYIDGKIAGNEGSRLNHSCAPNCEMIEDNRGTVWIHAKGEIYPGPRGRSTRART